MFICGVGNSDFCVAAPGTTTLGIVVRRIAIGIRRIIATTIAVFESRSRSALFKVRIDKWEFIERM